MVKTIASGNDIIFRYDNSADPRGRSLKTFPHHKHLSSGKIVESDGQIDLAAVLDEIEGMHSGD